MSTALKHVWLEGRCESPWLVCVRTSSCSPLVSRGSLSLPQTNPRNCFRSSFVNSSSVAHSHPIMGSESPPSSLFLTMPRSTSRSTKTSPHTRTISSFHVMRGSMRIGTFPAMPSRIASNALSISVSRSFTASAANRSRSLNNSGFPAPPLTTSTTRPHNDRTVQTSPDTPSSSPACTAPAAAATAERRSSPHVSSLGCVRSASTARTKRSSTLARSRTEHSSPRKRRQKRGGRSSPRGFEVRIPHPISFPMKRYCRMCKLD
mmetsp:Transcript_34075/g.70362  ORF Transcript_34075/g.70362 Transcript_34075/m.70362 type:complete len:262 (+) Transcript_34075:545-1330(+)